MTQAPPNLFDPNSTPDRLRRVTDKGLFLHRHTAGLVAERLREVNRRFRSPAIVGHHGGLWAELLELNAPTLAPVRSVLPLQPTAHDLVVHAMALHGVNDPVGQLIQSRRSLRPDGLFLGVMFGGQTLQALRNAFASAEAALFGGITPRVSPMVDVRAAGALLQRSGLAMPVADVLTTEVTYADVLALMRDLRAMGEANSLVGRSRVSLSRALLAALDEAYPKGADGRITAVFETVVLTGWAPDQSQPQPLRPGSATTRLADALGALELPTGAPVGEKPG